MRKLFGNPVLYQSASFVLFLLAFPLVSLGTTEGPPWLWALGLASLTLGASLPPAQRLFCPPPKEEPEPE